MIDKPKKTIEEVNMEELSEWSGENSVRRFKFQVPVLKFNGNTDKWSLLTPDADGNWIPEDLTDDIEIVVLKVRRVLSSYEKMPDGTGIRMFTNEHDSWKDGLTVFETQKGAGKSKMVDVGNVQDLRKRWPKLKLRQNLYCLLGDKLVKFSVKGKSLSNLFSYYQEFTASEHIFQFWTKLNSHSETNEGGLTYYVIDWTRGTDSDLSVVAEKLKTVKDALTLLDRQYNEMSSRDEAPLIEAERLPDKPAEDELEAGEEEIQVKDIPI